MNSGCSASNGCAVCSASALLDRLVPPQVALVVPGHLLAGTPDHQHVLDGRAAGDRLVDGRLERAGVAAPVPAVGGDDDAWRLASWIRPGQRVDREAAEDDAVRGADPGARQHGDRRLGDHRQVDGDPVARGCTPSAGQRVGRLADAAVQVGVGDGAGVARLALPVDGHLVAPAGLHVPVQAVVGDVELAADEPLRERRVRPVEHLVPLLAPSSAGGPAAPRSRAGRRRPPA